MIMLSQMDKQDYPHLNVLKLTFGLMMPQDHLMVNTLVCGRGKHQQELQQKRWWETASQQYQP